MDSVEGAERPVVPPGVLHGIDVVQHNPAFVIECSGWDAENEICENETPAKKRRLSLSLKKREPLGANNSRFGSPTKQRVFEAAGEGVVPTNTRASTNWALKTFTEWMKQRNLRAPDDPIPSDILESKEASNVCRIMRLSVLEARRSDGQPYPPATLRSLVSGIQRGNQAKKPPFLLLDTSDKRFREIHLTLDSVSSELHRQGIGAVRKSAAVISVEDDICFWEKGVMGTSSPAVLQNTVFFYLGLHFVLSGVQEQH
jgi:hypothetical protein